MMIVYLQMIDTPEEKSKFEKLYYAYRGLMFHVARQVLNNDQDAEDAVSSAFIKIAENIEKILPVRDGGNITRVEGKLC